MGCEFVLEELLVGNRHGPGDSFSQVNQRAAEQMLRVRGASGNGIMRTWCRPDVVEFRVPDREIGSIVLKEVA